MVNSLYVLYSTKDFLIRYIGITSKSLKERLYYHIKDSKYKRTYKEKWINKSLSENFEIRIKTIKKFNTLEELKKGEIELIKILRSKNYNLTNTTSGGDGLFNPSLDVRQKMRDFRYSYKWTEESREKLSKSKLGKTSPTKNLKWSKESKEKASKAKKGLPSNNKRKIVQYNLKGILLKVWDSITEAAKFYNISPGGISNNLKEKTKHCNKYKWKYE